ncbi:hypothetical protein SAMN05878391_1694 [Salinicoccus kekensis]|uniref:Uncharacterized protein n=1 Tax=Salinicoccus kekensis TaxID=714307 RepID=A0A285ULC5_9STAP|nr:hypothetical protein SAMN05878391_1694 [Salinicoccus kekensis]
MSSLNFCSDLLYLRNLKVFLGSTLRIEHPGSQPQAECRGNVANPTSVFATSGRVPGQRCESSTRFRNPRPSAGATLRIQHPFSQPQAECRGNVANPAPVFATLSRVPGQCCESSTRFRNLRPSAGSTLRIQHLNISNTHSKRYMALLSMSSDTAFRDFSTRKSVYNSRCDLPRPIKGLYFVDKSLNHLK